MALLLGEDRSLADMGSLSQSLFLIALAPDFRRVDPIQSDRHLEGLSKPYPRMDLDRVAIDDAEDFRLDWAGQGLGGSGDAGERQECGDQVSHPVSLAVAGPETQAPAEAPPDV